MSVINVNTKLQAKQSQFQVVSGTVINNGSTTYNNAIQIEFDGLNPYSNTMYNVYVYEVKTNSDTGATGVYWANFLVLIDNNLKIQVPSDAILFRSNSSEIQIVAGTGTSETSVFVNFDDNGGELYNNSPVRYCIQQVLS